MEKAAFERFALIQQSSFYVQQIDDLKMWPNERSDSDLGQEKVLVIL